MLFISILLSVWFVLWLIYAIFIRDSFKLLAAWMEETIEEYDEPPEAINEIIDKNGSAYHLSCKHCNHGWWSSDSLTKFCPECGKKLTDD